MTGEVGLGRAPTVDRAALDSWCRTNLGAGIAEELFAAGYLGAVFGVRLESGVDVVVKVRDPAARLTACWRVQQQVSERGFPAPTPIVAPRPLASWTASAEALVGGGDLFPSSGREPGPFAEAVWRLMRLAPAPEEVGPLDPAPPWAGCRHERELWPAPDDRDVDLNACVTEPWIDEVARAARHRLARATGAPVIGHGDWHTGNAGWRGDQLHILYDWDSVIAAPEPVVVGMMAAVYPATSGGTEATVDETAAFLDAYQGLGHRFSDDELQQSWAAGLWNRVYDAKKQAATEGTPRSLTEAEGRDRLRRAGG